MDGRALIGLPSDRRARSLYPKNTVGSITGRSAREKVLREAELTREQIRAAVRIAAVVHAVAGHARDRGGGGAATARRGGVADLLSSAGFLFQ